MLKIKYLIFISLLVQSGCGLRNTDLCTRAETATCFGVHSFACQFNKCTVSKEACVEYFGITFTIKSLRDYSLLSARLQAFNEKIPKCPLPLPTQQSFQVCANKVNSCSLSVLGIKANLVMRHKDCKCPGKLSFACGRNVCALNKQECDLFTKSSSKLIKKWELFKFLDLSLLCDL